jgi:hypothetical protein
VEDEGWHTILIQHSFFEEKFMTVDVPEALKLMKETKEFWPPVSVVFESDFRVILHRLMLEQVWRDISVDFGRAHYTFPGLSVEPAVAVHRFCYRVRSPTPPHSVPYGPAERRTCN